MQQLRRGRLAAGVLAACLAICISVGAAPGLAAEAEPTCPGPVKEAAHAPPIEGAAHDLAEPQAVEEAAAEPESAAPPRRNPHIDPELETMITAVAEEHGVDANLVMGIIKVESGFNPKAKSPAGACGLMQLMPGTARKMGAKNIFDPAENLQAGVKYFKHLLDKFGGVPEALAAYLRGPGAVRKHGGVPQDRFTLKFIERIMRHAKAFRLSAMGGDAVRAEADPHSTTN